MANGPKRVQTRLRWKSLSHTHTHTPELPESLSRPLILKICDYTAAERWRGQEVRNGRPGAHQRGPEDDAHHRWSLIKAGAQRVGRVAAAAALRRHPLCEPRREIQSGIHVRMRRGMRSGLSRPPLRASKKMEESDQLQTAES